MFERAIELLSSGVLGDFWEHQLQIAMNDGECLEHILNQAENELSSMYRMIEV